MAPPLRPSGAGLRSCFVLLVRIPPSRSLTSTCRANPTIVFQPSFASMSNIFGRRPLVFLAILCFFVGAIVAALSHNFTQMLVGRSIQGVGGGGIIALSEIIITDFVPLRHRGKYFGIFSAMWSLGSVTGPILGGGFAENVSWVSNSISTRQRDSKTNQVISSAGSSTLISPLSASESSLSGSSCDLSALPVPSWKRSVRSTTSALWCSSPVSRLS